MINETKERNNNENVVMNAREKINNRHACNLCMDPCRVNSAYNYLNGSRWIPWRGLIPCYKRLWHINRHLPMGTCEREERDGMRYSTANPHSIIPYHYPDSPRALLTSLCHYCIGD